MMKNKFLLCLILELFCLTGLYAQNLIGESRQTTVPITLQEYSQVTLASKAVAAGGGLKAIPIGARFTVVNRINIGGIDQYVVFFWNWKSGTGRYNSLNYDAANNEQRFFLIPTTSIDVWSEKIYRQWSPSVGALTFPFKYRPQNGKFEKTFALSTCGGAVWNPWRRNEHTIAFLFGVGASSVTIDQYNTDPSAGITESSDRTAITLSFSVMYQWERLQLGISSGVDNIFDNEVVKWKRQGQMWLTIGVGVSLFSATDVKSAGKN